MLNTPNKMKSRKDVLKINEIFFSIQGESSYAGLPCVFVRLTYCNLRCSWCDTEYAFFEGTDMSFSEILDKVRSYDCRLVEITGGEPLIQKNVLPFMKLLCDEGFEVLIETGGHMDIGPVDGRVKRIMDVKCPSSGESDKMRRENMDLLNSGDQAKFVLADRRDYEWAREIVGRYQLHKRAGQVLFSPVFGQLNYEQLAGWILEDRLPVRMQLQMHKFIWPAQKRGV